MQNIAAKLDRLFWKIPSTIPRHEQTKTIPTSNSNLRIRDSGDSTQALVFLCDPPITVEAYDELIEIFQTDYRVIVIELPGFGFSSTLHSDALTFQGAVEAVEAALMHISLDRIILFGPCICGFVAAELALRNLLPVAGLVLMQTPDKSGMLSWVERMDSKKLLRFPLLGQLIIKLKAKPLVKFWLGYATAKAFDAHFLVEKTEQALDNGCGYSLATMLQLWSHGTRDTGLDLPGLIIWGKQDRSHPATNPDISKAHLPESQVIEFSDCGHFTELENPQKFAASVKPFIEKCLYASKA